VFHVLSDGILVLEIFWGTWHYLPARWNSPGDRFWNVETRREMVLNFTIDTPGVFGTDIETD
jgi:hypothetical protein